MILKKITTSIFVLLSILSFSQEHILKKEIKKTYLDSLKKTFVKYNATKQIDSLWMKELTSLDLYNNLSKDIETINTDEKVNFELSTDLLKTRLAAMDKKSPFRIEYNAGLENLIKSFLKNRKKAFERLMATSEYYFPVFEEALSKKNVPLEIKYLAIVESALNPKAVSKVGATGLWQFMYNTGKQYNLNIDSYVDERSDVLKSSEAAAQYLSNMYVVFKDWDLVLASYNSGPGNVSKAIRRSGGQQNFWNIKSHLPKETQGYVPAFLATMYIYEYHKEHGIVPEKAILQHYATDTIRIKKEMSFKQISDLIDIPVVQLEMLNPSYKLNVVPAYEKKAHYLRLPQDKVAVFTANEDKIYAYLNFEDNLRERPMQKAIVNTIKTSKKALIANKTLKNTTKTNLKDDVCIVENVDSNLGSEIKNNKNDFAANPNLFYVVKKGDNLNVISKKYNISPAEIQEWNHIVDNNLVLGTVLRIAPEVSIKENTALETKLTEIQYVVKPGETLLSIAKKFGTSSNDLKLWNTLTNNVLLPGTALIVAKNEVVINSNRASVSEFKLGKKTENQDYYVKKGDSLYSISKKYPGVTVADLKSWNDIKGGSDLKPGMRLKING